jgi:hypothetical protein
VGSILARLGLGAIQYAAAELGKWSERRENAQTAREKIEAETQIAYWRNVVETQKNGGLAAYVRLAFAVPVVILVWKLFLWDKVLGWGVTDALSPFYERTALLIMGFYFLVELRMIWRR